MTELAGLRAMVVEDEAGISLLIEDMLQELGCAVAASVARFERACALATLIECDFAVLDVNLAGAPVFPVARILRDRRIPFLFSTGYGPGGIPEEFGDRPVLSKPFPIGELRDKVLLVLRAEGRAEALHRRD